VIDWTVRRMNRDEVEKGLAVLRNATVEILDNYVSNPTLDAMIDWANRFQENATRSALRAVEDLDDYRAGHVYRDELAERATDYHRLSKDIRRQYRRLCQYRRVYR
jgi:hypothetical protein